MTTIESTVIEYSISDQGIKLPSFQLRYPRPIHSEFMTHRVFSRNASSSRAIPVERLIQDVMEDPFVPLHWGKNQKGMQAFEESDALVDIGRALGFSHEFTVDNERAWLHARDLAVTMALAFTKAGYHKQLVNRLLEPFAHINVVATATELRNFFHLRDHADAEPHIKILAGEMKFSLDHAVPNELEPGQWHLPYVTYPERATHNPHDQKKLSVARCASVSYKTVDGELMTVERATALYDKLVSSDPLHASPTEHQATPDWVSIDPQPLVWATPHQHGNFRGWRQFRKQLPNENHPG